MKNIPLFATLILSTRKSSMTRCQMLIHPLLHQRNQFGENNFVTKIFERIDLKIVENSFSSQCVVYCWSAPADSSFLFPHHQPNLSNRKSQEGYFHPRQGLTRTCQNRLLIGWELKCSSLIGPGSLSPDIFYFCSDINAYLLHMRREHMHTSSG